MGTLKQHSLLPTYLPNVSFENFVSMRVSISLFLLSLTCLCSIEAQRFWPGRDLCFCLNPFRGANSHIGDPDVTCNRRYQPFCYVSCNSDCRDLRPARGFGRCFSRVACRDDVAAIAPFAPLE